MPHNIKNICNILIQRGHKSRLDKQFNDGTYHKNIVYSDRKSATQNNVFHCEVEIKRKMYMHHFLCERFEVQTFLKFVDPQAHY